MEKVVEQYGIEYLVHFTQAENLINIFKYGVLPVSTINKKGIKAQINDAYRFDYCEEATSMSIQFPNYKLFYKFRMEDQEVDWVVLALYPEILWEKRCAFCIDNAANASIANQNIQEREGVEALKSMYQDFPGKPSRNILRIPKNFPTNPQAEVLVFGEVEPEYIGAVIFKDKETKNRYQSSLPIHDNLQVVVNDYFFSYRQDWEYWKV